MCRMHCLPLLLAGLVAWVPASHAAALNQELDAMRFNQVQGIATSKSFHLAPPDAVLTYLTDKAWAGLSEIQIPQQYRFDHTNITEQLNLGITNLEIWIMDDYNGSLYAQSAGLKLAGVNGTLSDPSLYVPGFKLITTADWDYNSTVFLLSDFIAQVLNWTDANPGHLPLTIVVHPANSGTTGDIVTEDAELHLAGVTLKNSNVPGPSKFTVPEALGDGSALPASTDLRNFDTALRKLVPAKQLYTPDQLRLNNATLRDAVFPPNASWPTIGELRGKILFVADPGFIADYNTAFPNLTNAVMFTSDDSKSSDVNVVFLDVEVDLSVLSGIANTFSLSNKISSSANAKVDAAAQSIKAKVLEGYMVRTAVDVNLVEQFNNYDYRYKIFAAVGGAHWVMTATEVVQTRLIPGSNYSVSTATVPGFKGNTMICNPVTTNIYTNVTKAGSNSTVPTVACPYHVKLDSSIVIPTAASAPAPAPAPSAATPAFAHTLLPAVVLAALCLLSL